MPAPPPASTPTSSAREPSATTIQSASEIDDLGYGSSNRSSSNGEPWRQVTTTRRSRHELQDRRDLHQIHQVYRYPNQQARKGKGKGDRTHDGVPQVRGSTSPRPPSLQLPALPPRQQQTLGTAKQQELDVPSVYTTQTLLPSLLQAQLQGRTLRHSPDT